MSALPARRAPTGRSRTAILALACGLLPAAIGPGGHTADVAGAASASFVESDLWLLPSTEPVPALGEAASELAAGRPEPALASFARAGGHPVLGGYARLYQGRAEVALERFDAALTSARHVIATSPGGPLGEAALWLMADAAERAERWPEARRALEALAGLPASLPARVQLRLGHVAARQGADAAARQAFARIYYEYPVSPEAADAEAELTSSGGVPEAGTPAIELARADVLFSAGRYAEARRAYSRLVGRAGVADRVHVTLRVAQCDLHLRSYEAARSALRSLLDSSATHRAAVEYYHLSAVRLLRREAEYFSLVRTFVAAHPGDPLAERALNDLATYHILASDDAEAAATFEELLERFPSGAFADRASWKAGWWSYRTGAYDKAIRIFETADRTFPRADYRPAWLYWAARAHERLGRVDAALSGYQRTIAFYRNLYYGREAARRADSMRTRLRTAAAPRPASPSPPLTIAPDTRLPERVVPLVRHLLASGLYDDAILELRAVGPGVESSAFVEATIAYALHRKGELRAAITTMRRAYPQFMADGGEALPPRILKVIFPLDYWDLIGREAARHRLDPFLVAALVAQESTFQADVRSPANAWGLMQIVPGTGRRYAARLGMTRFSNGRLVEPDVNVRIGTAYLADLRNRFGDVAQALAAYNAGENRVERWRAERPDLERDEFIDDIPFPETQNYVKRILGTTEDYRLLYGEDVARRP